MVAQSLSRDSNTVVNEFRTLVENLAEFYAKAGVAVKPYHDQALPHFSALQPEQQERALIEARTFWEITSGHMAERVNPRNNSQALWSALKTAGLRPTANLFGEITDGDCIEIYNAAGFQIWRNITMLELCSYTLEEVHCFEWHQRYERRASDIEAMQKAIGRLLSGETRELHETIVSHPVRERFSELRMLLWAQHEGWYGLTDREGQLAALLLRSRGGVLSHHAESLFAAPALSLVGGASATSEA